MVRINEPCRALERTRPSHRHWLAAKLRALPVSHLQFRPACCRPALCTYGLALASMNAPTFALSASRSSSWRYIMCPAR